MSKAWEPVFVNMCSAMDRDAVHKHFAECRSFYKATDADVTMTHESEARFWEAPIKYHYRLNLHTYIGWKAYMLMTGCLASKPEYEDPNAAEYPESVEIPGCEW